RFVRTWKECQCARSITRQTCQMNLSSAFSWNKSDIELTKMRLGLRHCSGMESVSRSTFTCPVHTWRPPDLRVVPMYFSMPIACSRAAMRMAKQLLHPGEKILHPAIGFHVPSVHSMFVPVANVRTPHVI